jgi:TIR domain-containing protein
MPHWDTFISHSSTDKAKVRRLIALLKSRRVSPWVDEVGVQFGGLLRDGLQVAIRDSRTFVLVWSKAASKSRWVIAELLTAFHLGRFIIPSVLDRTRLPQFLGNAAYLDQKRDGRRLGEMLAAAIRTAPATRNRIMPLIAGARAEVIVQSDSIARTQMQEMEALGREDLDATRKIHAAAEKQVASALKRFPLESKVLNVAGYHQKNAYMLKHWDAIQAGRAPPDRILQRAERYFFAALQADPTDPSALNGVGSVLLFERELDAAAFFQRCALKSAKRLGFDYPEARQDLQLTLRFKKQR